MSAGNFRNCYRGTTPFNSREVYIATPCHRKRCVFGVPLVCYMQWVQSLQWSSWQSIGLVTKRLRVRLTPGPLQAILSKLLTYCVLRPTQPHTLSGMGNEQQLRLRGEGLVWLIGAMVWLLVAPWVQLSVSAGSGWPHNALRHHWLMLISCHFRDCKALLVTSLTHVSGAIASVQTFTFFTFAWHQFRLYSSYSHVNF